MKTLRTTFLFNKQGVSHAISAVIVTTTIIALVLAASMYAYQVLEQHRATAEFECAKESILAFNDALENVAWKPQAARSTRFTIEYGDLQLIPDATSLIVTVDGVTDPLYSNSTGVVKYYIKNRYVNFGEGYESYILGDASILVVGNTESYGRALIKQSSGWVTITLDYRVRAMRTSVIQVDEGDEGTVNYVDIWIVKVIVGQKSSYIHDFDLKVRCLDVKTTTYGPYPEQGTADDCTIIVQLDGSTPISDTIDLVLGKVVFNVIVTKVQVTV